MNDVEYTRELKQKFNNATYYVRALSQDGTLYVEVEQEDTRYKWKNQFVNSYIQEMTTKTGNFKTFDKFCRMIYSALESNNNGSVFIDLLTYQDLEILKARKLAKSGTESQQLNATQRTKNKRYLILTYVVEFDRVHYPLALKLDENSMDNQSTQSTVKSRKHSNNSRCTADTARKLLSHSTSPSSSTSSIVSSPRSIMHQTSNKHYQSTPNLNQNDTANANTNNIQNIQNKESITSYQSPQMKQIQNVEKDVTSNKLYEILLEENMKLKMMLKKDKNSKQYPSDKLTDIISVLEDEIRDLKKELERKNLEIRRITRNTKQYEQKHISTRLDDLEDEIERLSTELLSERTKTRRITRDKNSEKAELLKKIELLEASNDHYQKKCKSLKNEINSTKETLEKVRLKASKQRLYSSTSSATSLRRSRSRNNNKYYLNSRKDRNKAKPRTNNNKYNRPKAHSYSKPKYKRSSSAPRFQNKRNNQSRSRSPSIRFDPTEWAQKRKRKIEKSKMMKNTFGKSRSPSPFRTSRSVSPQNRSNQRKRSKNRNNKSNDFKKKRDRSNSRKRNSFGTTISISPKSSAKQKKHNRRLPLPKNCSYSSSSTVNDENDLDLLNTMQKRQKRIMNINNNNNSFNDADDDDDDDESIFNPTKEIESIDSRLNALQKFLRAAKSTS